MITTFAADLTSMLAPFGWAAVGFVAAGLGAVVTALIVARASRPTAPTRAATSAPPQTAAIREATPMRARPTDDQDGDSDTDGRRHPARGLRQASEKRTGQDDQEHAANRRRDEQPV